MLCCLLSIGLIVYFSINLAEKLPHLISFLRLFALVMVIYLFNCNMDASGKLTWMLLISIFPVVGTGILLFTKTNLGHRMEHKRTDEQIQRTKGIIPQAQNVIRELEHDGSGTDDLSTYLNKSGCFPLYDHTEVTYFPIGEKKFSAMMEELEKAQKFIFMEYFIIEEGYMWGRILDVLIRKAKEGVDVRVMYDGMCEMSTLPADYWKLLEAEGIKAKAFSPIKPFISTHYNYRDHRKILVIDGKVAFNGGVNLADEYINRIVRFGHWKDTAVMLKGEAVKSFTLLFLQMWYIGEEEPDYDPEYYSEEPESGEEEAEDFQVEEEIADTEASFSTDENR